MSIGRNAIFLHMQLATVWLLVVEVVAVARHMAIVVLHTVVQRQAPAETTDVQ